MFDSNCKINEDEKGFLKSIKAVTDIVLQTCMALCLIYIAYKLVYRPLALGVDILIYSLVDIATACLIYLLFNKCFYILHGMYKTMSFKFIMLENFIVYGLNILLAVRVGYSLYYSKSYFISVCVLLGVNIVLNTVGLKIRHR